MQEGQLRDSHYLLCSNLVAEDPAGASTITKANIVNPAADFDNLVIPTKEGIEMYLLLRFTVGVVVEALVLSRSQNQIRLVAADIPDTIDLKRSGSQWFTETGEAVELDFLMSDDRNEKEIPSKPEHLALVAGA